MKTVVFRIWIPVSHGALGFFTYLKSKWTACFESDESDKYESILQLAIMCGSYSITRQMLSTAFVILYLYVHIIPQKVSKRHEDLRLKASDNKEKSVGGGQWKVSKSPVIGCGTVSSVA